MKDTKKTYWKGLEQLTNNPEFVKSADKEFPDYLPTNGGEDPSRRDFLKSMGFGVAAATLAACESPIRKAIPWVEKPVDIDPSIPNYYASTFVSGSDYCSIVVKTREGRPIKIDGNSLSAVSGGGTSPQVEASVLSMYDQERLKSPMIEGKAASWEDVDSAVLSQLGSLGGKIAVVSNSVASPSTVKAMSSFLEKYDAAHVQYDQVSMHGTLSANEKSFGVRAVPFMDFSKAETIVSVNADFLGGWLNSTLFNKQFASTRKLHDKKKQMSRLYSFESNLTLTGSNADYRTPIKPSQEGLVVANIYNVLAQKAGVARISVDEVASPRIAMAADDLWNAKGKSIFVSGSNDTNVQVLANAINYLLGNYGKTLNLDMPYQIRKGNDEEMSKLITDLKGGSVAGIIFYNCNPVYDHPMGSDLGEALKSVPFSMATNDRSDETSSMVKINAPDHHFLESWNDFEAVKGHLSLSQPTISNIFDTRQAQSSFLRWSNQDSDYFEFVKANWQEWHFGNQEEFSDFQMFWDNCLHNGVYVAPSAAATASLSMPDVTGISNAISANYKASSTATELVLYTNAGIGTGTQANNPWLQEMSDPITKACWDNYLTVPPSMATALGLKTGDMITQKANLTVGGKSLSVPIMIQPGQAKGTVGLALGYGRTKAGKVANGVGVNAYPLADYSRGFQNMSITAGVDIQNSGESYNIAQTQTHQTYMNRENVVQEATLAEYQQDPYAGRDFPMISTYDGKKSPKAITLWNGHEYPNHHWGMIVDLNSCTGCGACTIACQAENNIPVVGKEEVLNRREMAWLRIDRYYSSDADADDLSGLEEAAENPEVTFQPMMCQQCNNAPCETVCPVAATTHSSEGLNQMTYNRCIGTRYCANNCPYKVRRFNWFKYHDNQQFGSNLAMNNDLGKMVLNPDVTVRARGVMEKCTFCVQRVQAGKLTAKREGRRPVDGEIVSACAAACPSEAIVFGDLKNPESRVAQMLKLQKNEEGETEVKEARAYHVLEEIRVDPNVWYYTKIRNKEKEETQA